jgi:hypothetical protein
VDAEQVGGGGRDRGSEEDAADEPQVLEEGEPEAAPVAVAGREDDRDQDREVDEVDESSLFEAESQAGRGRPRRLADN